MSRNSQFDSARDELFGHIHRCNVLRAVEEDQVTWMSETVEYLGERYPELGEAELEQLNTIGMRFCRPVIAHGKAHTALTRGTAEESEEVEEREEESGEESGSLAGAL